MSALAVEEEIRWVRRGLILVAAPPLGATLTARDVAQMVACPTCRAKVSEQCRTSNGNSTVHDDRLIPRRCPCGELLRPKKQLCETCRQARRTETYALRETRQPTRLRRANPPKVRGFERDSVGRSWENETARTGALTPAGPNPHSLLKNERG